MNILSVVCPNCRSRLSIENVPGVHDKMLTCPICKYKAKVSLFQLGRAGQGGQGSTDDPTVNPDDYKKKNSDPGQMKVIQTGQILELREGSQVLGRLAKTSTADLQIGRDDYNDPYMSRQHMKINVVNTASGLQHQLVEIGSKNIIKLNDKDISRGDVIVLKFGDKLTLGNTTLILEETDEEATKIV